MRSSTRTWRRSLLGEERTKRTGSKDKEKINLFHRSQGGGEEGASKGVRDKQILSGSEQVPVQRELRPVAESCRTRTTNNNGLRDTL